MQVQRDSVVFAYSGGSYFTSGGNTYLRDHGPHGFHMRFAAGGAAPTPQLDGSLYFDGGDYCYFDGDLTRFYAQMPTTALSWLYVASQVAPAVNTVAFSCMNVAGNRGIGFRYYNVSASGLIQMSMDSFNAAGVFGTAFNATALRGVGSTNAIAYSYTKNVKAIMLWDHKNVGATLGDNSSPIAYDASAAPHVCGRPAGGANPRIRLYYLALLRGAVNSADLAELSSMLMGAVSGTNPWPFCGRT